MIRVWIRESSLEALPTQHPITVFERGTARYLENRDVVDIGRASGQQGDFELPSILQNGSFRPTLKKVTGATYSKVVFVEAAS